MNLLLQRKQHAYHFFQFLPLKLGSGVTFKLKADLELTNEERELVRRYQLSDAILFDYNFWLDLKMALKSAVKFWLILLIPTLLFGRIILAALVEYFTPLMLNIFLKTGWIPNLRTFESIVLLVVLVLILGVPIIYYFALREEVRVRHLTNGGRTFRCESVVALIHKEADIEGKCSYLRQLLESAKHWDERETIPIPPLDKINAKLALLKAVT